jgi:hypothetical protein
MHQTGQMSNFMKLKKNSSGSLKMPSGSIVTRGSGFCHHWFRSCFRSVAATGPYLTSYDSRRPQLSNDSTTITYQ